MAPVDSSFVADGHWTMTKLGVSAAEYDLWVTITPTSVRSACPMMTGFLVYKGAHPAAEVFVGFAFYYTHGREGVRAEARQEGLPPVAVGEVRSGDGCFAPAVRLQYHLTQPGPLYLLAFDAGAATSATISVEATPGAVSVAQKVVGEGAWFYGPDDLQKVAYVGAQSPQVPLVGETWLESGDASVAATVQATRSVIMAHHPMMRVIDGGACSLTSLRDPQGVVHRNTDAGFGPCNSEIALWGETGPGRYDLTIEAAAAGGAWATPPNWGIVDYEFPEERAT
jgi:hypothetical protein